MIDCAYIEMMTTYNQWFNERLFKCCGALSDQDLKRDRGAFFKSIYGTLNHLLECDYQFLASFTAQPVPPRSESAFLYPAFADMWQARSALDRRLCDWSRTPTPEWLLKPVTFESRADGLPRTVPRAAFVVHMFNHQTHHRGQVTTLLSQAGLDVGLTDLHGSFR